MCCGAAQGAGEGGEGQRGGAGHIRSPVRPPHAPHTPPEDRPILTECVCSSADAGAAERSATAASAASIRMAPKEPADVAPGTHLESRTTP